MSETIAAPWEPAPAEESFDSYLTKLTNVAGNEELHHAYGEYVHLHTTSLVVRTKLAQVSCDETKQPRLGRAVRWLYMWLLGKVIDRHFPSQIRDVRTPMAAKHGRRGHWIAPVISEQNPIVVVDIARAGTVPADEAFMELCELVNPDKVRKDTLFMARKTDASGHVIGTDCSGSKVGDSVDGAIVLITDPMGATGFTLRDVLDAYKRLVPGTPLMIIAMSLIITPEMITLIGKEFPDVIIHAGRVDRGNSSLRALSQTPGVILSEESGLTDEDYIAPGAGGIGERMNNCYA